MPQQRKAKNPAAVALGRLGGLKGGVARMKSSTAEERRALARRGAKARARKLTPERRSAIARQAGKARWKKRTDSMKSSPGS